MAAHAAAPWVRYSERSARKTMHSNPVYRHLEINVPVFVGRRKIAGIHVDLDRGDDELGGAELLVARRAHRDEFVLANTLPDMDIVSSLFCNCCFPNIFVAARRLVVVAQEEPRFGRK